MSRRKWPSSSRMPSSLRPAARGSIIFADIEGFTRLSESLPPAQVIGLLNSFFSVATAIIDERGGVVVNYVGDALIAAFNAPFRSRGYPARAVGAARALLSLVSTREFEGHRLRLRIGIATGPVAAGTVGGAERQTYTLYGDTVNLAQRLEAAEQGARDGLPDVRHDLHGRAVGLRRCGGDGLRAGAWTRKRRRGLRSRR